LSEVETARQLERKSAVRRLLVSPLILAQREPEEFDRICRHAAWLIRWFDDVAGWRLSVEPTFGFARLFKIPAALAGSRPARTRSGVPFDRRRYALLSLALSALSDLAGQTTVKDLAERVRISSQGERELEPFDSDRSSERRAFVDALLLLADAGILRTRDGDAEGFARDGQEDALYDVNDRLLVHFLGGHEDPIPDTEEGRKTKGKQEVVRMALDEPVLYLGDLNPEAREWFNRGSGWLYERLSEDVGLAVERRLEGLAAVDTAGEVSDEMFPDGGSTAKHAALLLAEQLVDPARRDREIGIEEIQRLTELLLHSYSKRCGWSRQYGCDASGASSLAADTMILLENFGLVRRIGEAWRPLPAIARFRPGAPGGETSRENES
jgi:hypothetical protein